MLSQMINAFDDVKFEAASVLAELYEQQNQSNLSKPILRKAIELSQHSIYWHCRLIFQLAQIHATEKDYELASSLLGVGVDYAHISQAHYTRVLFLLSRCMRSKSSGLVDNVIAVSLPVQLVHRFVLPCFTPRADFNERKTSLEIVPISKISFSRGADQKYKLNCNGKAIEGLPRKTFQAPFYKLYKN
ncbi:mau2 chromatid cohesion factor [Homalodisca vitripennis]|nr:mau2 chromatid cohesion factor [Homalodisca vitripennis]